MMRTGMLWYDGDAHADLQTKIQRAAAYYEKKYGRMPTLCFVHPSMLPEEPARSGAIELRSSKQVLPNHLWLGVPESGAN